MDDATPSPPRRYGIAVLAVLLALLLDLLLWPWAKPTAFPLFTAAVLFASWYGGLGPGLLATALATVAGRYFFAEPYYTFTVDAGVLIRLAMFAVMVAATTYATNVRRRSERALGESEGRYRTLTEALPQLVWTCRPDGSCDYLSRQWVEYTGVPEDEQLGMKWLDRVIHPEDRERAFSCWTAAVEGRGAYDLEYRILGADGRYRWFQTRGLPLRDAGGGIAKWFGTCTDIDEKKRAETGLREAKEAAEEANRAKDAFLAALSHELRTPLTPVLLTVSALHSDPRIPEELRDELWMVRRNVEMEARLIDDLLDLTRIAQGKLELRSEVVNLHDIARHAATICRPEIEAKGLTLTLDLRARRHRVRGDGGRLQQVLWNLLKNAAKFTPEGGTIALVTEDVGSDGLRIRVSDTGIGIPPEALPRLFDAFEQGDRADHQAVRRARARAGDLEGAGGRPRRHDPGRQRGAWEGGHLHGRIAGGDLSDRGRRWAGRDRGQRRAESVAPHPAGRGPRGHAPRAVADGAGPRARRDDRRERRDRAGRIGGGAVRPAGQRRGAAGRERDRPDAEAAPDAGHRLDRLRHGVGHRGVPRGGVRGPPDQAGGLHAAGGGDPAGRREFPLTLMPQPSRSDPRLIR